MLRICFSWPRFPTHNHRLSIFALPYTSLKWVDESLDWWPPAKVLLLYSYIFAYFSLAAGQCLETPHTSQDTRTVTMTYFNPFTMYWYFQGRLLGRSLLDVICSLFPRAEIFSLNFGILLNFHDNRLEILATCPLILCVLCIYYRIVVIIFALLRFAL